MSILNQIPTPSFEFNPGLVDNRGALALVRQGQDITGQSAFPFVRNGVKNVPDKLGILRAVPANEPAVTFDGQGRNLGYLAESARTNQVLNSRDFASWGEGANITGSVQTVKGLTGRKMVLNAEGNIGNASDVLQRNNSRTYTNGQQYTVSFIAKKTSSHGVFGYVLTGSTFGDLYGIFSVNDNTTGVGSVASSANYANRSRKITPLGNDEFLCEETFTFNGTTGTGNQFLLLSVPNSVSSNIQNIGNEGAFGAPQIELGGFASSRILTDGSALTRPADILTFTDASDFIGQSEGVIYAEVDVNNIDSVASGLVVLTDSLGNDASNRIMIYKTATTNNIAFQLRISNTNIINHEQPVLTNKLKLIGLYKSGYLSFFVNGTKVLTDSSSFTLPLFDIIKIGRFTGSTIELPFNDPIRSVRLWKTADWCDDATAQLLTRI
jgi:hypothetical protein